jgi:hypothetical protein
LRCPAILEAYKRGYADKRLYVELPSLDEKPLIFHKTLPSDVASALPRNSDEPGAVDDSKNPQTAAGRSDGSLDEDLKSRPRHIVLIDISATLDKFRGEHLQSDVNME